MFRQVMSSRIAVGRHGICLVAIALAIGACAGSRPYQDSSAYPEASLGAGTVETVPVWGQLQLAQYQGTGAGDEEENKLGDRPAGPDEDSRLEARLSSATGTPHINDVARRVVYNAEYFEVHIEVNGERGIVPVTSGMVRSHTPLTTDSYYARVYVSRGWSYGRQVPGFGPRVILPEAFTPELTPDIFAHFKPVYELWARNRAGWAKGMHGAWNKATVSGPGVVVRGPARMSSVGPGGTGAVRVASTGFKAYTRRNFRHNLGQLTGGIPKGAHAHHVLPVKFATKFKKAGINIHNPRFGAWWGKTAHQQSARAYNEAWRQFFKDTQNPTAEQILQFGRNLAKDHGLTIGF